jgi:hypothetical protein
MRGDPLALVSTVRAVKRTSTSARTRSPTACSNAGDRRTSSSTCEKSSCSMRSSIIASSVDWRSTLRYAVAAKQNQAHEIIRSRRLVNNIGTAFGTARLIASTHWSACSCYLVPVRSGQRVSRNRAVNPTSSRLRMPSSAARPFSCARRSLQLMGTTDSASANWSAYVPDPEYRHACYHGPFH